MIGQYLSNTNESVTIHILQKNLEVNKAKGICPQGTHNADSIIESKVIYFLEQCGLGVLF